jgi:hypothetical protein
MIEMGSIDYFGKNFKDYEALINSFFKTKSNEKYYFFDVAFFRE